MEKPAVKRKVMVLFLKPFSQNHLDHSKLASSGILLRGNGDQFLRNSTTDAKFHRKTNKLTNKEEKFLD